MQFTPQQVQQLSVSSVVIRRRLPLPIFRNINRNIKHPLTIRPFGIRDSKGQLSSCETYMAPNKEQTNHQLINYPYYANQFYLVFLGGWHVKLCVNQHNDILLEAHFRLINTSQKKKKKKKKKKTWPPTRSFQIFVIFLIPVHCLVQNSTDLSSNLRILL